MTDLPLWLEILLSVLLLIGGLFALVGALGLLRFPDFYMRLHAPTKATTLGVGGLLLASMGAAWWRGDTGVPELMITLFLFITAPISAHLLARAALHLDLPGAVARPPPDASASPESARDTPRH